MVTHYLTMAFISSCRAFAQILLVWFLACSLPARANDPAFSVRLVDGSVGYGDLLSSQQDQQLVFHVDGFVQAFQFRTDQVSTIRRIRWTEAEKAIQPGSSDRMLFTLRNREQIIGQIVSMNESQIVIDSASLGTLVLPRAELQLISQPSQPGRSLKSIFEAADWQDPNDLGLWDVTALKLSTTQSGSRLVSTFEMPMQAELKISLRWSGKPSFSIGMGVALDQKTNQPNIQRRIVDAQQKPLPTTGRRRCFASLEVWDSSLILVRESVKQGKFAYLGELSSQTSCDLTVYLDRQSGVAAVQTIDGKIHTLQVDPKDIGDSLKAVMLQNFGSNLAVEKLELYTWDGQLPPEFAAKQSLVMKRDDSTMEGVVDGWDAASSCWIVRTPTDQLRLPADELKLANFTKATPAIETTKDEPVEPKSKPKNSPKQSAQDSGSQDSQSQDSQLKVTDLDASSTAVELIFQDGSRVYGQLFASPAETIGFLSKFGDRPHPVPIDQISEIRSATKVESENVAVSNKLAEIGLSRIRGDFLSDTPAGSSTALLWKPTVGLEAAELDYAFSGEIRSEDNPIKKVARQRPVAQAQQPEQPAAVQQEFNIFLDIFGGRVARPVRPKTAAKKGEKKPEPAVVSNDSQIRFRSGDIAPATIRRISDAGVQFESTRTATTFAPDTAIDQIFFRPSKGNQLTVDERKRLLTVPRSQKNDPPTHLVISLAGDYLRGHLIEVTSQRTVVEVRGEMMEFPTEELSEIVWLYDRDWTVSQQKEDLQASSETLLLEESAKAVHVVCNDQGLTLLPQRVEAGILHGTSKLLGQSTVKLEDVTQLFFGPDTSRKARQRRSESYQLSLAKSPKEQIDSPEGGERSVGKHPLIGNPAPEFVLKTLTGEEFRLAEQRGQVSVLDFWASWCGPCMQAMPQLDQLLEEINSDQVQLIAVNIQETKPRIELAMERLQINCKVILDVEGEAAAAYKANAIPQTVIIDKAGVVADVIVGGGPKALEQIRQTIVDLLQRENDPARAN